MKTTGKLYNNIVNALNILKLGWSTDNTSDAPLTTPIAPLTAPLTAPTAPPLTTPLPAPIPAPIAPLTAPIAPLPAPLTTPLTPPLPPLSPPLSPLSPPLSPVVYYSYLREGVVFTVRLRVDDDHHYIVGGVTVAVETRQYTLTGFSQRARQVGTHVSQSDGFYSAV